MSRKLRIFTAILALVILGVAMSLTQTFSNQLPSNLLVQYQKSPQYLAPQESFVNKKRNVVFNPGGMWSTFIDYFFGKRVDPSPKKEIPLKPINTSEIQNPTKNVRFIKLGHSSILLQIEKKNWLIDPVFSLRASPFQFIGPKRFHPVPLKRQDFPEIEGIIISHDHYDHLDYQTILNFKDKVKHFLVPLGVGARIMKWGVEPERIKEFDWWDSIKIGEVEFISTPAHHFSGRGILDKNKTLWTSWVIKNSTQSVYFSGDSGYFEGFKEIGEKYGPFDLTFIEDGAYDKNWANVHMFPEETVQAFEDLKGKLLIPVHNGTFDLALHSWYEPMERVIRAAERRNVKLLLPHFGELIDLESLPKQVFWWK